MPWTEDDVKKHNKEAARSARGRARWKKIANAVLRDCRKEGGEDCEGKAIRIANTRWK